MAKKPSGIINARTLTAPIGAIIMAGLLYTYSVTSIRAAKRNAQLHREADGGQLDMRRESLRRHGALGKVEGTGGLSLFKDGAVEGSPSTATNNSAIKGEGGDGVKRGIAREVDKSAELEGRKKRGAMTTADTTATGNTGMLAGGNRSDTEAQLEQFKGRGKLGLGQLPPRINDRPE